MVFFRYWHNKFCLFLKWESWCGKYENKSVKASFQILRALILKSIGTKPFNGKNGSKNRMSEPSQEEVISLVNSMFEVTQFNKGLYSLEFRIEDYDFKEKFEDLAEVAHFL